ncbi:MAG: hypothetical protein R3290_11970, partial [Acidimicrobiia bacterium]|nr:hypothetical protein [Acidimicrobiia bacterium]
MRRTRNPRRGRRFGIVGLALALLGGLLLTIPTLASAKDTINYEFVFEHQDGTTTTVTGTATEKDAFIPDAGGTSKTNPTGMVMHLSCSDEFPGGWGEKEGPDRIQDSAWRVQRYTIQKGDKTCSGGDPIPPPSPAIDVEKATNGEDADDPTGPEIKIGDTVTWTYVVTNTGDSALSNVELVDYVGEIGDSDPTAIDCPRTELGVGESMTCEATGTAMEGQYRNTAKVTAEGPAVSPQPRDEDVKRFTFVFVDPATGDTTRVDGDADGGDVFLPNTGGTDQQAPFPGMEIHISCSDEFPGGYGEKNDPDPIEDSAWQIESFWIREIKKDGEIKTKCGSPIPNTQMVMDSDPSHYIGVPGDPAIDIEKATNGVDADTPDEGPELFAGDTVTWTYVVTNTGDVDLEDVTVEDDQEGFIGSISFLGVGESLELTETGTVGEGNYRNEACARAVDEDGNEVDDCDPSHYNVPDPDIDIEKATNGEDADDRSDAVRVNVGDEITWTYVVTNTGDQDLVNVEVNDDEEGFIGTIGFLAVGDSATLTARGTAVAGLYGNVGCATGETEDDGRPVEDCDPSHYKAKKKGDYPDFPSIDIEKATNGHDADHPTGPKVAAGSTVTWTYEVTNTGDETLYGVFV